jgi:hypothetical protein
MIWTAVPKAMWLQEARTFAFCVLALLLAASTLVLAGGPAYAATFTVNRTGDTADANLANAACDVNASASGNQCTLRAAIQESNDTAAADVIRFNIASNVSVKTISPTRPLPTITRAVTIDGYSQPGTGPNTRAVGNNAVLKIQLNGANAGQDADGLVIGASDTTIRGLVINRFGADGILGEGPGATGNRIQGNFIGTNAAGTADLGNGQMGMFIAADNTTIGGTAAGERNVISGNGIHGIIIFSSGATGNKIQGNYIGTNAAGTSALGNGEVGLLVVAPNNTVGGTVAGAGNVISGNGNTGVDISGSSGGSNNRVEGNRIGTKAGGTGDLGNRANGVNISSSDGNTIGGAASGAGNLIAGNDGYGIGVSGSLGSGNAVLNNAIRANGDGGVILSSNRTTVRGNSILANDGSGVDVFLRDSEILSNQIFANAGLGIDLRGGTEDVSGVTANDTDDSDTGSNDLQNFPVITSATRFSTGGTIVSGTLNSNPNQAFTIQCFLALDGEPSNHGEGQILVAQDTSVQTGANGDASFSCATTGAVVGQEVSATATNTASGDTSEFSLNRPVTPGP